MALGGLGTLIALERAVALGRAWGYVAPAAAAAGALCLVAGAPARLAASLLTVAGLALVAIFAQIMRIQPSMHTAVMTLAATAWPVSTLLWMRGWPISRMVPWLTGFLVLTVAAERVELARVVRLTSVGRTLFLAAVAVTFTGVAVTGPAPGPGARIAGAGLLGLALWMVRYDVARRTVRMPGLTRYVAAALLAGYAWLGFAGALWIAGGTKTARLYDASLHAIFLGFIISMVFGHAPIILPAVLRIALPYRTRFYAHLGLLHASLAARVAGDLLPSGEVRRWGALLGVVAILLFLANTATAVRSTSAKRNPDA